MKMSPNKEDYIKAIFGLSKENDIVSNKDIANKLSISAASVTDMISRLVKEGMVTHYPYKGVKLTETGIRTSNQLIRKHRVLEVFLYEKLGFKWNEVHEEADRLEHASSDKFIERLDEFLDHPTYDPHGGVIPNADGTVDAPLNTLLNLSDLEIGDHFLVREVSDDEDLLNYLHDKNFSLNKNYELQNIDSYDGTITISDDETGAALTISEKALSQIKVSPLPKND
ncbi:iron (metal) dependent repressor, DtxR family [Atopostipes suicloacalis DSM 15692]|uniref:Manganese transport regulator n=1 Tax=Atopostipes suicloacalis DSM 15692 TaxID=1121025 RepID=A0A1M4TWL5_9LACT|nr:metal-dependent transcriptional regulator [Atopostipes suicloacalis]SHE48826.1 iron (metal) dependent repressor, DtxR family [Atopostipes suicloacalis DSM 15692]